MGHNQTSKFIIKTDSLSKYYGSVVALDNLTLNIKPGVTALLGPNGAGKTTLIKLLLGLIKPTTGQASILGFDSQKESLQVRQKIGVLHEKPRFPMSISSYRFLSLIARFFKISTINQRVKELLTAVDLWTVRDRIIGNLSAGMIQRLGLAQALLPYHTIILLDEPTANLDPLGRIRIINLIQDFAKGNGISFVISSHILFDLERVCSNVVILDRGELKLHGNLRKLISKRKDAIITLSSFDKEIEAVLNDIPGVLKTRQIDTHTWECHIEDVMKFERSLFQRLLENDTRIESLKIESSLERLYEEVMTREGEMLVQY
jgi:ABC-2 type transport system ATP-binding protein